MAASNCTLQEARPLGGECLKEAIQAGLAAIRRGEMKQSEQSVGAAIQQEGAETHPLYRDDEQGFALRKSLVGGMSQHQYQILEDSMPQRCAYLLREYRLKVSEKWGRVLQEEDYVANGVQQHISKEAWDRFWAKAAPNKAQDGSDLHHNLFKGLRKLLKEDKDDPDKELLASRTSHSSSRGTSRRTSFH